MTAVTDATECWGKMLSDLEGRFLRLEKENSRMGCLESCFLNLENIVLRMDNENSIVAGSVESRILQLESLVLKSKKPFVNVVSDVGGERTRAPVVELESLEHSKNECVKLATDLEKSKVECTTLQGKLAEVAATMTAVTEETECWGNKLSDLET